jgi:putative salt-induced outer membrane protein YdiY
MYSNDLIYSRIKYYVYDYVIIQKHYKGSYNMRKTIYIAISSILLTPIISYASTEKNYDNSNAAKAKKYQYLANKYSKMAQEYANKANKEKDTTKKTVIAVPKPIYNPWQGTNASAGGNYNTGNTAGSNLNTGLLLTYSPTPASDYGWVFNLNSTYQYSQSKNDGMTANKLVSSQTSTYMFNQNNGVFTNVSYTNDHFDTFKYQLNESLGYKRVLYKNYSNTMILSINLGPGFIQTRTTETNYFQNAPSFYTLITYDWNLSQDTVFSQTLTNTASKTNTNTTINSSVTTTLYNSLALQTSFEWSFDSKVAAGLEHVNTLSKIGLIYNF